MNNVFLIILIILGATVAAVEFGVWIMGGILNRDEHHAGRTPLARIVGYAVGVLALVAFLALAIGAKFWAIIAIIVGIPISIALIYRRPRADA